MNIDPTNNPMHYLNSGDKKSLLSDTADAVNNQNAQNKSTLQQDRKQDDIHLSQESKKIKLLNHELKASDSIDREKVADVKKRLDAIKLDIQHSGTRLESAAQRIADKIIDMDEALFSKK